MLGEEIVIANANFLAKIDLSADKLLPVVTQVKSGRIVYAAAAEKNQVASQIEAILKQHIVLFKELISTRFNSIKQHPINSLQLYYTQANMLNGLLFFFDQQILRWGHIIGKLQTDDPQVDLSQFDSVLEEALSTLLELRASLKLKLNTIHIESFPITFTSTAYLMPKTFRLVQDQETGASLYANYVLSSHSEGYIDVSDMMHLHFHTNPVLFANHIYLTWNCYPEKTPARLKLDKFKSATFKPSAYLKETFEKQPVVTFKPINLAVCISHLAAFTVTNFAPFLMQSLVEIAVNDGYAGIDLYAPSHFSAMVYRFGFYPREQEPQPALAHTPNILENYIMQGLNRPLHHFHLPMTEVKNRKIQLDGTETTWSQQIEAQSLFHTQGARILPVPFDLPMQEYFLPSYRQIREREITGARPSKRGLAFLKGEIDNAEIPNNEALKEIGESQQLHRGSTGSTYLRKHSLRSRI